MCGPTPVDQPYRSTVVRERSRVGCRDVHTCVIISHVISDTLIRMPLDGLVDVGLDDDSNKVAGLPQHRQLACGWLFGPAFAVCARVGGGR